LIRIVDPVASFLYSILLSAGAVLALVVVPPVGLGLLFILRHHMHRQTRRLRSRA
jgi:hypothetical protein